MSIPPDTVPFSTGLKKVLIVYQEIPENVSFYQIDVTPEEMELLNSCHGHYINATMDDSLVEDLLALIERAGGSKTSLWTDRSNAIAPLNVEHDGPVIVTGFVM